MGLKIIGTGSQLGSRIVTCEEVAKNSYISAEEIIEKTGIKNRFYLTENETLLDLACKSTSQAIENTDIDNWDSLFCATYAHDLIFPSLASRISSRLDLKVNQPLDIQSNCTGFINALILTAEKLKSSVDGTASLIVAAEHNSAFIDSSDKDAAMFWSDGAASLVIKKQKNDSGLMAYSTSSNFDNNEAVRLNWRFENTSNNSKNRIAESMVMGGLATWRQATSGLPTVINSVLEKASLTKSDIDYYIFHQANLRMIEYLIAKNRLDPSKVLVNVDQVGNTGAASIPIIINEQNKINRFRDGDLVLMAAVGAGFTFTSAIWKW